MKKENCLNPKCQRLATMRGVCYPCYQLLGRMVRDKRTTWAALEKKGKVLAKKSSKPSGTTAWALSK